MTKHDQAQVQPMPQPSPRQPMTPTVSPSMSPSTASPKQLNDNSHLCNFFGGIIHPEYLPKEDLFCEGVSSGSITEEQRLLHSE